MTCAWCSGPMPRQRRGTYEARFCSPACRTALHTAARRWALAALDANLITIRTLKEAPACREDRKTLTPRRAASKPKVAPAAIAASAITGGPVPS